ncbi:limonene-1,2-epoxide hydrolase family protein [Streptomyces viridosporus]|uniref:limonene-1,2-epoxide hydrolase family protein n=1 Tax=Streptomyces viridosporus TaxID=67581 RepID=UPI0009BE9002|nr:limonene-1,2-epoxide hydrolase family protein [Streptomyces viridosporus]
MNTDPLTVVRDFFAHFGPTHDDMVATARRLCHDDLWWASAGFDPPRVTSLEQLVADLEKAKARKGVAGFRFELVHAAADGPHVLTERYDDAVGADGELLHSFKVMGTLKVEDGRIRWVRDYFYDTREFAERYLPEDFTTDRPPLLDDHMRAGD